MKNCMATMLATISLCIILTSQTAAFAKNEKNTSARITEAHGDVYKRGFVDWEKEEWGEPSKATKGDVLLEGTQVGTGDKSWAQLTWSYITARAWANSVYAIAPNQRLVYLMGGEMLYHLDKNRKDKSDYFVWTKLIQARLRGTTVLFQCHDDTTRVTVLEGVVDILNRKDKSVIRLEPGVVYEIKELNTQATPTASNISAPAASSTQQSLTPITLGQIPPVNVFETKNTVTSLYVASPQSLLSHPLVNSLEEPLTSLPLVGTTLNSLLPTVNNLLDTTTGLLKDGALPLLSQAILSESKVLAVPTTLSYNVGSLAGTAFALPQSITFFPPKGVIGQLTNTASVPGLLGPTGTITKMSDLTQLTNGSVLNRVGGSLTNVVPVVNVIPSTATATNAALNSTLGSVTAGRGVISGATGVIGGVTGTVGGVTGLVGGVTGGVTGTLGGVVNGVGGTVGGLTGGGTSGGGLVGGVGNAVGGLTGGLGSILGGGSGGGLGLLGH